MNIEVGKQLRAVRTAFGLSQRELAKRAGVTNGMVSLIEQGRVSPSVGSLQKILAAFPMTMAEFFTRDMESEADVVFRAADLPNMGTGDIEYRLVAASRRDRKMSILWETYAPDSDTGEDLLTHSGEEGGVVVEGELLLCCHRGRRHTLGACRTAFGTQERRPHGSSAPTARRLSSKNKDLGGQSATTAKHIRAACLGAFLKIINKCCALLGQKH